ncbi:hypothetical protein JW948_19135 [bacterium]|nr:hypothetical protein [bacterium]
MNRGQSRQESLFGTSEMEGLRHRIKDMDAQISHALKNNDYAKAKKLTDQQAELLQAMLEMGENAPSDT